MGDRHLDLVQSVLSGLAAGSDAGRLARDILAGAVVATGATGGAVLRAVGGDPATVATSGTMSAVAVEAGRATMAVGRALRRRDPDSGLTVAAEPLRAGTRVVGALVVTGTLQRLDPAPLPLVASAAALVVDRYVAPTPDALPGLLQALSDIGADVDTAAVLRRALDAAHTVFGARAGLCALHVDGALRVVHHRGMEAERLLAASRLADFRAFLSAERLAVATAAHPVVAQLAAGGEVAACLPLSAAGQRLGQVVLLLGALPDAARTSLLDSFARHVAVCVRSAQLHRSLADHEEQLTSMVHSMAHPVVVVDEQGRLVEVNGAAAEAFRLAGALERGQPVAGRLGHAALEGMLTAGREAGGEVVVGADEPRVYRATVRRTRSGDGRVTGRILVLDDLTTVRQADALKSDFVAVIGHELRTPLTVVKGYLNTLVRRGDDLSPERRAQALHAVETNVARLERLIEDLLFVSAIEQHRTPLTLELNDLATLLDQRAGPRVVVHRPDGPVTAAVDVAKLDQVLHHLLDNALKYSDGEVVLELADRGDVVEISVSDSGPGIYSGDVPRLFERFRQLDGTSTRANGGVGIGLYICRRVVEALGGRIWCESRLGVGSRFTFTLPKQREGAGRVS
ncbi:MAG: ATP-binding protein [Actinomycetota bacterium]|nr:ATP-binding protein [Actinomycetota bacterium]